MHDSAGTISAGHVKLSVSDFTTSKAFYEKLFMKLGFEKICDEGRVAGWSINPGFSFWIEHAQHTTPAYTFFAPGLHHICFRAASPIQVDALFTFLQEEHIAIFNQPKKYPDYTDDYYAVFFADPDGIKLELAYY